MTPMIEVQLIAVIVAVACSIPGVFLVLRKMAMMSDAITHTILLGIVIAFFIVHDLSSPLLVVGATLVGILTVFLIELLRKTRLVKEDSAIGIVFPLLFSLAIIMITRYAGSVHLDTDSVLLGELAFAPYNRLVVMGHDIGAKALYLMGVVMLINIAVTLLFFKEIKLSIFDEGLAAVLGFYPTFIYYGITTMVSITTVGAFEAVGSILVIAFMVGPPISAYLLTDDLKKMLIISSLLGAANALIGYRLALWFDVSIAGSMASVTGLTFLIILTFAPARGLITTLSRRSRQRVDFAQKSMLFHILNHEDKPNEAVENGVDTIYNHLNWSRVFIDKLIKDLLDDKILYLEDDVYKLTEQGRTYTKTSYTEIVDSFRT